MLTQRPINDPDEITIPSMFHIIDREMRHYKTQFFYSMQYNGDCIEIHGSTFNSRFIHDLTVRLEPARFDYSISQVPNVVLITIFKI